MSLHESDIKARVGRFLERKTMPQRIAGKTMAQDDEMRAIIGKITSHAPRGAEALATWWPYFEAALSEIGGDFWPSEKQIKPAAQKATEAMPRKVVAALDDEMSPAAITARKMQTGGEVGEGWLWGIGAVELAARKLIDEATMRRYRSGAFLARRQAYGEAAALRWEAEKKAEHEAAKEVWRHRKADRQQRDTTVPDLRDAPDFGDAA
jgi:hypothetical protein